MLKLQILNVSNTCLSSKGASHLLSAFSSVKYDLHVMDLDISKNDIEFDEDHLRHLQEIFGDSKTLENINLSYNRMGDEALN